MGREDRLFCQGPIERDGYPLGKIRVTQNDLRRGVEYCASMQGKVDLRD